MFEYEIDISANSYTIDNISVGWFTKLPLYIGGFGYYESGPRHYGRCQDLPYCHILYTISGEGKICNETLGETISLKPGMAIALFCFYPGDVLLHCTASPEPWVWKWLRVEGVGIQSYASMFGRHLQPVKIKDIPKFDKLWIDIEQSVRQQTLTSFALEVTLVSQILYELSCDIFSDSNVTKSTKGGKLGNLLWHIQLEPQKQYSVKEMSESLQMSQYTLIRTFKSLYGVTPYQYIQKCRISKAENLLRITNMTLEAIAEECGFYDAANLTRCFKKNLGYTPAAYRKMIFKLGGLSTSGTHITWV